MAPVGDMCLLTFADQESRRISCDYIQFPFNHKKENS